MKTQIIKELNIDLPYELEDFLKSGHADLNEYCHGCADGSVDVIYYGKAESLYNQATTEERDEAEASVEDCGGFGEGADMATRFTLLAYWITYNRLMEGLREQAEELAEKLTGKRYDVEELIDTLESL